MVTATAQGPSNERANLQLLSEILAQKSMDHDRSNTQPSRGSEKVYLR